MPTDVSPVSQLLPKNLSTWIAVMAIVNLLGMVMLLVCVATLVAAHPQAVILKFVALQSVALPLGWVLGMGMGMGILTMLILPLGERPGFSMVARQLQARLADLERADS
ncbi:MAG: hypothetical protein NW237_15865 [Cyanobacteriota bacterium]|nr:hypothetical protein [Cyanobacteriota bacterium]